MSNKVPTGDKKQLKSILLICNVIISLMCVISIAGYFLMPLWEVKLSVTVTPELAERYAPKEEESSEESGSSTEGMIRDILKSLADEDFKLEISGITLDTYSFVSAAVGGTTEPVKKLLDSNVGKIMENLSETIESAIAPLMKSVVVTVVKEKVKEAVKEAMSSGENLDDKTKEALEEMGFTEEFIEDNINDIIDVITDENATVDTVSDKIMDVYEDVMDKFENSETFANMSEEDKQNFLDNKEEAQAQIEEALKGVLEKIADEDGSINMTDILSNLLLTALENGESSSGEETAVQEAYAYSYGVAYADDGEESSENATEQIKARIMEAIMSKLSDENMQTVAKGMQYVGYLILFTFFTWAYLVLKIIVKLGAKNPGIKLKLPMWLGYIPYTILVLIPSLAVLAVKNGLIQSIGMDMGSGAEDLKIILDAINITFSSGGVFSFVFAIILFVFSFVYGHYRRKLKRIIRYERKNGIA